MATVTNDYAGAEIVVQANLAAAGDVTPGLALAAGGRVIMSALNAATWTAGYVLLDRRSNLNTANWHYTGKSLTKNSSSNTGQETDDLASNTNGQVRLRASSDFAGPVTVELVVSYTSGATRA